MLSPAAMPEPSLTELTDAWLGGAALGLVLDRAVASLSLGEALILARHLRSGGGRGRLRHLEAGAARAELARDPGLGPAAILTLHRNGHVREAALEVLAGYDDPVALRYFALRLDDIVPAIRERARVELERRLLARDAPEIVALLPLARRLSRRARAGVSAVLRALEAFLVDPARGLAALLAAAQSPDAELRLAALPLALRRSPLGADLVALHRAALADPDPRLGRLAAVELTSSRVDPALRDELLPLLLAHRDASLRRRALLAAARAPGAEPHLERALLDPRALVRLAARDKLRDGRSRALYRRTLAGNDAPRRDVLGALAGLSEVGLAEDAALALRWLEDTHPRLQAEAVRCLSLLAPGDHRAVLEAKLGSPYGRVRREAERAAERGARWPSPDPPPAPRGRVNTTRRG